LKLNHDSKYFFSKPGWFKTGGLFYLKHFAESPEKEMRSTKSSTSAADITSISQYLHILICFSIFKKNPIAEDEVYC